jgi:hypothetical protein
LLFIIANIFFQGISRLITSSQSEFRDHVVRRGLAFILEGDFYATEDGDIQYQRNIRGIVQSVQETQNYDTMFAILNCKRYHQEMNKKRGTLQISIQEIEEREINEYANVATNAEALEIMFDERKRLLTKRRVSPDLFILWPGAGIYLTKLYPERTQYYLMGPDGVMNIKEGPSNMTTYRGVNAVETRDFDIYGDGDGDPVMLNHREITVGEYYPMAFKWRGEEIYNYESRWRDLYMYDETQDNFYKVTFKDAFLHTKVFGKNGYSSAFRQFPPMDSPLTGDGGVGGPGPDMHLEDEFDDARSPDQLKKRRAFFLWTKQSGQWEPVNLFINLDMEVCSHHDFVQVGQSIVGKIFKDDRAQLDAWDDMMNLIQQIERQSYNGVYWRKLIEMNIRRSLGSTGLFVGDMTPQDLFANPTEHLRIREWVPNAYGGMDLPPRTREMRGVDFPAGFANWPGLCTLAAEADKDNGWRELGVRARSAVALISAIVGALRVATPTSYALNTDLRSPWFHSPDSATVFFSNLVSVDRDPLFLPALPVQTKSGADIKKSAGGTVVMKPITEYNPETGLAGETKGQGIFVYTDASGVRVGLTADLLQPSVITRSTYAKLFMGSASRDAYDRLVVIANRAGSETREQLDNFIIMYATQDVDRQMAIRKVVLSLNTETSPLVGDAAAQEEKLKELLGQLVVTESSTTSDKKKAAKTFMTLVEKSNNIVDNAPDQRWLDALKYTSADGEDITSTAYRQSSVATAAVRDLVERILRQISVINVIRKQVDPAYNAADQLVYIDNTGQIRGVGGANAFPSGVGGGAGNWTAFVIPAGTLSAAQTAAVARHAAATAELDNLSDQLQAQMVRLGGGNILPPAGSSTLAQGITSISAMDDASNVVVLDDIRSYGIARWYRAPLTSSTELVTSLLMTEYPLVRPSDFRTNHLQPLNIQKTGVGPEALPTALKNMLERRKLHFTTVADLVAKPHAVRNVESLSWASKHMAAEVSASESNFGSSGGGFSKGGGDYMDDDDDDGGDYEYDDDTGMLKASDRTGSARRQATFLGDFDATQADHVDDEDDILGMPHISKKVRFSSDHAGAHAGGQRRYPARGDGGQKMYYEGGEPYGSKSVAFERQKQGFMAGMPMNTEEKKEFYEMMTGNAMYRYNESNKIQDPVLRACVQAVMFSECKSIQQWVSMMDNNVHVPANIVLFRLFIEHEMATAVLMKGGYETGANLFGHSNFVVGYDVVTKMVYGNFTFNSKGMVWRERNIEILQNVAPRRYIGGNNLRFMRGPSDLDIVGRERPSIIACLVPITETEFPLRMDFTGKVDVPNRNTDIDPLMRRTDYTSAELYSRIYNVAARKSPSHGWLEDYFGAMSRLNTVAYPGTYFAFDRTVGRFADIHECQGHRKANGSGRGCKQVWNGQKKLFPQQDWTSYILQ